jgi:hypothetical protein
MDKRRFFPVFTLETHANLIKIPDTNLITLARQFPKLDFSGHFGDETDEFLFGAATEVMTTKCQKVDVSFRVRDQGWGNQKGELMVHLKNESGNTLSSGIKWEQPFTHGWTEIEDVFDENDSIVQLSGAGCRYEVWYKVGGGGAHELHVDYFRLIATMVTRVPLQAHFVGLSSVERSRRCSP